MVKVITIGKSKYVVTALNEKGETLPMTDEMRILIEKEEFVTVSLPLGLELKLNHKL